MSGTRAKDPLAKAPARPPAKKAAVKRPASTRSRSSAGPLESAVIEATSAATLTGSGPITAAIARQVAKAADKAEDQGELLRLVAELKDLLTVFDPEDPAGGDTDDADSHRGPVDRKLARIMGSGPQVLHSKDAS